MHPFLKTGGFLVHRPDRILVFHGPFTRAREAPADRPALYAPDFFLEDATPWFVADRWEDLSLSAFQAALPASPDAAGSLEWEEPDRDGYAIVFAEVTRRIDDGELLKAVPVAFACATPSPPPTVLLPRIIRRALGAVPASYPFGLWDAEGGVVGATPELLFDLTPEGVIRSMALAGTTVPGVGNERLASPKERTEHRIVVDDMLTALAPFGPVECGPTSVVDLPHLAHLKTEISVRAVRPVSFTELVRAVHPTPALGGSPRAASLEWLKAMDRREARGRFGAPFGYRAADGTGRAVVAIRSVEWTGDTVRLGAGAGVVAGSRLEGEWTEIRQKHDAVRRMLLA